MITSIGAAHFSSCLEKDKREKKTGFITWFLCACVCLGKSVTSPAARKAHTGRKVSTRRDKGDATVTLFFFSFASEPSKKSLWANTHTPFCTIGQIGEKRLKERQFSICF
nr:hypothetical protein [Pandoravirus massiliensis]